MREKQTNEAATSGENTVGSPGAIEDAVRNHRRDVCTTIVSQQHWVYANRRLLWIYAGVVGSLLLRASVLDFESGDYKAFLGNWYDYFVQHGRWAGLKDNFTGYPVLYLELLSLSTLLPLPKLYTIKLLSIFSDYIAAWYVFKVVRCKYPSGSMPIVAALSILFLPTVWFNSAVWGQCDVMHTGTLLAALYFVISRRPSAAMISFGLACAFKPQGILLAPFFCGVIFRERFPWKCLVIPPLVYAVCGLPAMLAGRPAMDVLLRWAQHTNYPELTMGATNWYQWVSNEYYQIFFLPGVLICVVATVFLMLAMQETTVMERGTWLVTTALSSVLLVPYSLPGMHERYFYAADLFSLVYAFFVPRGWIVALLVQFCSFFTYLPYLFNLEPVPRPLLAVVMTAALMLVGQEFVKAIAASTKACSST